MIEPSGVVSLFCGPGGLDTGFARAGFAARLAYDYDAAALTTYGYNHPGSHVVQADVATLTIRDLLKEWRSVSAVPPVGVIGGAPCQSFSFANVNQKKTDRRHVLPYHYGRLIEELHRRCDLDFVVFENVPGFAGRRHSSKLARLRARLSRAGFTVSQGLIDAQHFGVPQVRPRLFVIGINKRKYPGVTFELPERSRARRRVVRDALGLLPEPVYYRRGLAPEDIPYHPNHWCMQPRSSKLLDRSLTTVWKERRSFKVLRWDEPSYTVAYGHREVHVHPRKHRRLSIHEAMLLQGFPHRYVLRGTLSDQVRLVSEAVPPAVGQAIGRALRRQLMWS